MRNASSANLSCSGNSVESVPATLRKSLALICRTAMEKSSSNGRKRGTWLNRGRTFPYPRSLAACRLDASSIVSSSTPGRSLRLTHGYVHQGRRFVSTELHANESRIAQIVLRGNGSFSSARTLQSLLVHEGDMPSCLEGFHESAIKVRRLRSSNDGKNYFREVVLENAGRLQARGIWRH